MCAVTEPSAVCWTALPALSKIARKNIKDYKVKVDNAEFEENEEDEEYRESICQFHKKM